MKKIQPNDRRIANPVLRIQRKNKKSVQNNFPRSPRTGHEEKTLHCKHQRIVPTTVGIRVRRRRVTVILKQFYLQILLKMSISFCSAILGYDIELIEINKSKCITEGH